MFSAIFNYIEHLFDLIKPKQLFYMAIDGVAPRAKMNQQRSRRFRSALEAEEAREKAIRDGIPLSANEQFDTNAITPGTEFMAKLTVQLKYFIHKKVSTDANWQNIEVILSGHEVPGEGEHKIMEHIRVAKASPGYSPDVRHCLYGLDADLIMLGLLSHDPHFAILREEVTFGRARKTASKELHDQNFYLLHLSIVREYLELEFSGIEKEMPKLDYEFERLLDDFILINFFIGNDFLPELPSLVINEGALPIAFDTYKNYLRKADGYITSRGIVDFERLKIWMQEFSAFEYNLFEKASVDAEWFNEELEEISQKGREKKEQLLILSPHQKDLVRTVKQFILDVNSKPKSDPDDIVSFSFKEKLGKEDIEFLKKFTGQVYARVIADDGGVTKIVQDIDGIVDDESEDELENRTITAKGVVKSYEKAALELKQEKKEQMEAVYSEKYNKWKAIYYKKNFGFAANDPETPAHISDVVDNYLEGLQWVLLYYYRGVASWGWYYRYHYAPRVSDISKGLGKKFTFELGKPFKPFEQLMAVLPDRSKALVPAAFRSLMTDDASPIKDFYPRTFELDMNGKKNAWEAIVKIPFVDQDRLLKALHAHENELTPEEKARNEFGTNLIFDFNPQVDVIYPSSFPGVFPDLEHSHCIESVTYLPPMESLNYIDGLVPGAKLGVDALAGFPSLKTIPFTFQVKDAKVVIFQQPSRNDSIILTLQNRYKDLDSAAVTKRFLNRAVYFGYPYLNEGKVVSVSDELFTYAYKKSPVPHPNPEGWHREASAIRIDLTKRGINISPITHLIKLKPLIGLIRTNEGGWKKEYAETTVVYPLQTIIESVQNEDQRYIERPPVPIEEEFPLDSQAIFLGPSAYGNPVKIIGYTDKKLLNVEVQKLKVSENNIGQLIAMREEKALGYVPSHIACKRLNISPYYLSRITAKYIVFYKNSPFDVGLNLRNESKRLKVLGYTRRENQGWTFSSLSSDLIFEYLKAFPVLHRALIHYSRKEIPDLASLIPSEQLEDLVKSVKKWLKEKVSDNPSISLVSLQTEGLSKKSILALEQNAIESSKAPVSVSLNKYNNLPRNALLSPSSAVYQLKSQHFSVGDRVVYVLDYGKVPLFSRGTVLTVSSHISSVTLDVLFDVEFPAGTTLNGRTTTKRGLVVKTGAVLNLSKKQLVFHTKKSLELAKQKENKNKGKTTVKPTENIWKQNNVPVSSVIASASPSAPKGKPFTMVSTKPAKAAPAPRAVDPPVAPSQPPKPKGKTVKIREDDPEKMRVDLLSMIKGTSNISVGNDNAGSSGGSNANAGKKEYKKKNKDQTTNNVVGAVFGQFVPPQPLYPQGPFPNNFPPVPPNSFPPAPPNSLPYFAESPVFVGPNGQPFPPPPSGPNAPPMHGFYPGPPPPSGPAAGAVPQAPRAHGKGSHDIMASLNDGRPQQAPVPSAPNPDINPNEFEPRNQQQQKQRGGFRGGRGGPGGSKGGRGRGGRGRGRGGRGGANTGAPASASPAPDQN